MANISEIMSNTKQHLQQLEELRNEIIIADDNQIVKLISQLKKDGNDLAREGSKSRDVVDASSPQKKEILGSIELIRKSGPFLQLIGHHQHQLFKAFDHIQEAIKVCSKPAKVEKPAAGQKL